jgi:hypothetical protein
MVPLLCTCVHEVRPKAARDPGGLFYICDWLTCFVVTTKHEGRSREAKNHCSAAKEFVESAGHRVSICERDSLKQTSKFERNARS